MPSPPWTFAPLASLTRRIGSGITPRGGSAVYRRTGRPFIRSQNVGWGRLHLADLAFIDEPTHNGFSASETRRGDVLLNITGASIGRSAVATERLDGGNVNQHVCEIRLDKRRMDARFVCEFLLSRSGQDQIAAFQAGGNREGLNFKQVGSIQVPVPQLAEQQRIGSNLADAEHLISVVEQLIAKKEAIKQGMMQQLLTGKTRLPGFTAPWQEVRLGDVATMGSGGTPPSGTARYYGGGIPWASISDMTTSRKYVRSTEKTLTRDGLVNSAAKLYHEGVVLYAMYASLGECALPVGSMSSSQAILGILPSEGLERDFLYYHLCSRRSRVKEMGQQGTQSNLNAGMVRDFRLDLPPLDEQRAIAAVLADADANLEALRKRLSKVRDLKRGLMQELLTGKTRLSLAEAVA